MATVWFEPLLVFLKFLILSLSGTIVIILPLSAEKYWHNSKNIRDIIRQ
jgi:hypothetical protein